VAEAFNTPLYNIIEDNYLMELNDYLLPVADRDLLIFHQFITLVLDRIIASFLYQTKDVSQSFIMTSPSSFLIRMIDPYIADLHSVLFEASD
jgi:hypothetical protein